MAITHGGSASAPQTAPHTGRELLALVRTAAPIAMVGLVNLAMSITDAVLMADLDPTALTAGVVVGDVFSIVVQFAAGALGAVAAPVAAAHARRDAARLGRTIADGLRLAVLLALLGAGIIALAPTALISLGVRLPLPEVAADYAAYMAATFAIMQVVALARSIFPAFGAGMVVLVPMAAAVPLNLFADLTLMHGWFGITAMGLAGAGAASLLVALFMAVSLILYMALAPRLRHLGVLRALLSLRGGFIERSLFNAGIFTGATALCETGVYLSSTVVIAFVAIEAVPAHIIVFRTVAVSYVIALGFAQAVTVHAAQRLAVAGPGRPHGLGRAVRLGMAGLATIFLGLMLALPKAAQLAGIDPAPVAALAQPAAISVCALVPSVVAFGLLKANADVALPSLISLAGYWGVGFGLILLLAGSLELGAAGVWAGLAAGSTATAAGSWLYLHSRETGRSLRRAAL
jgi:MATE family multidrug resistance protein